MATQYEIEHNIKSSSTPHRRRQVDMASFTAHLSTIAPSNTSSTTPLEAHNNPHAVPNPADLSALFRLLQDQMGTLATTAPNPENRHFLEELVSVLEIDVSNPPTSIPGVSQEFVDSLERVNRKTLKKDDTCPICAEAYLDDKYCLVVELPCHHSHRFDLECVGPWLRSKGTCPLCRKELEKKKEVVKDDSEEEGEDMMGLYA
ncbi:hypothetical protein B0T14DRAFT_538770 [Immersiella caudata]|uniref:RING-type domain-containing protein n=1 Tax=Immersiella caudata TaxID=314043 RepID=A0AA39WKQ8_9PEZI|nr:hypothetical protein B0T14DRAFT_538770 [Immersiella caudata]